MTKTHAIIAGGGTAGHVVPGLAIASELVARGVPPEQVHYVGSARGIETRLVPEAGFPLTVLPGRGIQRRLTLENVRSVFGLLAAIVAGIRPVRRLRPSYHIILSQLSITSYQGLGRGIRYHRLDLLRHANIRP